MGEEAEDHTHTVPFVSEQYFSGSTDYFCCRKSISVSKAVQVEHLMIPKVI